MGAACTGAELRVISSLLDHSEASSQPWSREASHFGGRNGRHCALARSYVTGRAQILALAWEDDERDKPGFWLHAALRPGFPAVRW
jgi:hypothetical protein